MVLVTAAQCSACKAIFVESLAGVPCPRCKGQIVIFRLRRELNLERLLIVVVAAGLSAIVGFAFPEPREGAASILWTAFLVVPLLVFLAYCMVFVGGGMLAFR